MSDPAGGPSPPAPLAGEHDLEPFDCGAVLLDSWLKRRARANQASGASRTYVVCEGRRVVAYSALASGAVAIAATSSGVRRNMPEPIPMIVLGRLAVDRSWRGRGLGRALLRDAIERSIQAAGIVGARGLLVHALNPAAKRFYESGGLVESPIDPMLLMVSLSDANLRG